MRILIVFLFLVISMSITAQSNEINLPLYQKFLNNIEVQNVINDYVSSDCSNSFYWKVRQFDSMQVLRFKDTTLIQIINENRNDTCSIFSFYNNKNNKKQLIVYFTIEHNRGARSISQIYFRCKYKVNRKGEIIIKRIKYDINYSHYSPVVF